MKKMLLTAVVSILLLGLILPGMVSAADGTNETASKQDTVDKEAKNKGYIAFGVIIGMALAGIFSAIGLGLTGASAVGVVSEKRELFSHAMVLQVLPMTQGIYGLVGAIILLLGGGFFGTPRADLADNAVGMTAIAAGLVIGLTGLSAIPQGQISSAGISALPRNDEDWTKSVIFAAMPETMAIFGLLIAILLAKGAGFI